MARPPFVAAGLAIAAMTLAACASGSSDLRPATSGSRSLDVRRLSGTSNYIQHFVMIVQENRSFDNLFATFPGADGATTGKRGRKTIHLHKAHLAERCDFGHSYKGFLRDYDGGKMDGFHLEGSGGQCSGKAGKRPYQYVDPKHIQPYWDMASQYVLADHMFQTQGSGSFTAHQDLIRGGTTIDSSQGITLVDWPSHIPWGCDAQPGTTTSLLILQPDGHLRFSFDHGPFPCSNDFPQGGYSTLRDLLDEQGISWKYYTPALGIGLGSGNYWDAFDLIAPVRYGPEWGTNVPQNEKLVLEDILTHQLPSVSWVIPDAHNSDHPGTGYDTGPSWVTTVVNAIGQSAYWKTTAIVVIWDDWGGFYDHEPPPFFDNWGGLGFRVPMILISPYARETSSSQPGYISHTQYEFGSLVKFVEDNWNLGSLGTTDQRANSILDCFDFTQSPRSFVPIHAKYSRAYFERQPPSGEPVDTE